MEKNLDNFVLYENISQCLTLAGVASKDGRGVTEADLGIIENASMVVDNTDNVIVWVGGAKDLPTEYAEIVNTYSAEGEVWIPELVECHTHLVHAGSRHSEYAQRAAGSTYQEIAAQGGGILYTLAHTRETSREELLEDAAANLERFQKYGVGTVEIKSGYGLDLENEIKILEVIEQLKDVSNVLLVPTFLPAHAVPPEYKGRADEYVEIICREWIPEIARRKLAVFFDAFIDQGAFTVAQGRKMAESALSHGMKLKLHCDQFSNLGATELGVELGAKSCDHLDHLSESSLKNLAQSKTVAVLCPGASLYTGTPFPPARRLIDEGGQVALSTDFNPGTSPTRNLPLMTTLACSQMKMTVPEAIAGVTYNAAAALGLQNILGSLEPGKVFRVCPLTALSYEVLAYSFGEMD